MERQLGVKGIDCPVGLCSVAVVGKLWVTRKDEGLKQSVKMGRWVGHRRKT